MAQKRCCTANRASVSRFVSLAFRILMKKNEPTIAAFQRALDSFKQAKIDASSHHHLLGPIDDESFQKTLIDETIKKFGRLDVLVSNAGVANLHGKKSDSVETLDHVMRVNVRRLFGENFCFQLFNAQSQFLARTRCFRSHFRTSQSKKAATLWSFHRWLRAQASRS